MKKAARAFAPATVANVAVGFDSLGLAIDGLGDEVVAKRISEKTVKIAAIKALGKIAGHADESYRQIPLEALSNTAAAGLFQLLEERQADFGVELTIYKGIPLGSGLGGSAASAVAALVAANALLPKPLAKKDLLTYAVTGEAVASGSRHADNVAPCLLGGLSLVTPEGGIHALPFLKGVEIVVVHPGSRLDTKAARAVLPAEVSLHDQIIASRRLASFVAACYEGDLELFKQSLQDDIIEPARENLIEGFQEVKTAALKAGALGCSISGAGPAVFALCLKTNSKKTRLAMEAAFRAARAPLVRSWQSGINKKGAHLVR